MKGLFKKRNLLNGIPATEQNIRLRIITGGRGMPPFEQILSAKEMDQAGNVILLRKDLLPVLMSSASTLNLILGWW